MPCRRASLFWPVWVWLEDIGGRRNNEQRLLLSCPEKLALFSHTHAVLHTTPIAYHAVQLLQHMHADASVLVCHGTQPAYLPPRMVIYLNR